MNCDNMRGCCSPCSQLAQQLEETNTRAVQAYNLAAQAFAATHPLVSGRNIDITLNASNEYEVAVKNPMDEDVTINADLTVNGDIYQNGSAYETHAEQLYTTKDTVIMRDGATTGLAPGDVAGLIMKKYDGVNDGALVVSSDGTARVGDVGSEQPLMTRDESGSMINGELLQWNGTGQKAVCSGVNLSQIVRGSDNIGSDTKPVKVVGGVATAVTDDLLVDKIVDITYMVTLNPAYVQCSSFNVYRYGKVVSVYFQNLQFLTNDNDVQIATGLPKAVTGGAMPTINWSSGTTGNLLVIYPGETYIRKYGGNTASNIYQSFMYLCE